MSYYNVSWKLLSLILAILLLFIIINKSYDIPYETFDNKETQFITKNNDNLYDKYYVDLYDTLCFNKNRIDYEILSSIKETNINQSSYILDIGSGP